MNDDPSFSAPLLVPSDATSPGSAGGKAGVIRPTPFPESRPSGEVLTGTKDPPLSVDNDLTKSECLDGAIDNVGTVYTRVSSDLLRHNFNLNFRCRTIHTIQE